MRFDVHGFPIPELAVKRIWKKIERKNPGLSRASGRYIFSMKHGKNFKPWYVGKAENTRFSTEEFNNGN